MIFINMNDNSHFNCVYEIIVRALNQFLTASPVVPCQIQLSHELSC